MTSNKNDYPYTITFTDSNESILAAPRTPTNGWISGYIQSDPCAFCNNNPKNNPYASGICCCALPAMYRIIC